MAKKPRKAPRARRLSPSLVHGAMLRRVLQRTAVAGIVKIPAVPALVDEYLAICSAFFAASGRAFSAGELEEARATLAQKLNEAFAGSPRSKIAIKFQALAARPLAYEIVSEVTPLSDAYEKWIGTTDAPLFGAHPDARVWALARELGPRTESPVLDLGAGTGRNALALAREGHPVDAVEITPKFAELIAAEAQKQRLDVRVVCRDVFRDRSELDRPYRLLLASEVAPDFRGVGELRQLFELAAAVLAEGGYLVFNIHLAVQGYTPEKSAREFSQQCYSALFTASEVVEGASSLPFELVSNDSVYDYERAHLPEGAWPPTPWYENWIRGLDVYELEQRECPVELRWLVFRKTAANAGARVDSQALFGLAHDQDKRARRFDSSALRQSLVRRLKGRAAVAGSITLPAVPALLDPFLELCVAPFRVLERDFSASEVAQGRQHFQQVLSEAFAASPRSNVVVEYEAPMSADLKYTVTADPVSLASAYEEWFERAPDLFGSQPDARVLSLESELGPPSENRALDLGAGLGRNALELARRGHAVDAVELTPKFAELLAGAAAQEKLDVRVLERDLLRCERELRPPYRLVLASGVTGDFRDSSALRELFALAARVLAPGGLLLLSAHVAFEGYTPELAAREWAQQNSALFFTRDELANALAGLPFELAGDDSAFDFEQGHLPESGWPPTPEYPEWASGTHLYALEREHSPIELRWLLYRRSVS
ncbi:MAG TPA: methyltransferase domain-containing protein [Polyangiaceae bacterium]|jgi:SAM-dependent methyltransferase